MISEEIMAVLWTGSVDILKSIPSFASSGGPVSIAVIDCTDLYHPFQDCGDNIDILIPYSLLEIDLCLVLLDATDRPFGYWHPYPGRFVC